MLTAVREEWVATGDGRALGRDRHGQDRARDHVGGADHDLRLPQLHAHRRPGHQDDGRRHGGRRGRRRHDRARPARALDDDPARRWNWWLPAWLDRLLPHVHDPEPATGTRAGACGADRPASASAARGGVPRAGGRLRTAAARSRRSPSTRACGPSHSAVSGCGCTSTMMPSAPIAIAARESGTTRSRRPPECDGSTTIGRCARSCVDRHRGDVEGVARRLLEGADPALAQHDVEVAALRDVLRRHQPLLDRRAHAALEHDRLAGVADGLQQREVLGVARADLQHVGVRRDELDVAHVDDLGDHRQAGLGAHVGEDLQARARRGPGRRTASDRGLNAPPRSSVAPAALAISARPRASAPASRRRTGRR